MTLLERGYRPLHYVPTPPLARTWPVADLELRTMFRMRLGAVLYLVCLAPNIGSLIFLMVRAGIWDVAEGGGPRAGMGAGGFFDPSAPGFFLRPIFTLSMVPFLILTTLVTARSIAKDRAAGALEMYWTRGITPAWYFAGKWAGSFLLLGSAFVAVPMLLWLASVLLAPDWGQFQATIGFIPAMLAGLTLVCAVLALIGVAISAVAGTANFASILWLLLSVGTLVAGQVLWALFRENWMTALNPWRASRRIVEALVGAPPVLDYPPWIAAGLLGGTAALALLLAARRLRVVEVVAT